MKENYKAAQINHQKVLRAELMLFVYQKFQDGHQQQEVKLAIQKEA